MYCQDFTLLFRSAQRGDRSAENEVYRVAFRKLRGIAASLISREAPGHTLQPTALVGELFFKLRGLDGHVAGRDHFFRLAGRAMKQVLVDHARRKRAQKRINPDESFLGNMNSESADPELTYSVREVMDRLRHVDPKAAETVWMRRVEGRTLDEIALVQKRKVWKVRADYDYGVKWMLQQFA